MTATQRLQTIESTRERVASFVHRAHLLQSWEKTSVSHLAMPALAEAEERPPPSRAEARVEATRGEHEDLMITHRPLGPSAALLPVSFVGLTPCTYFAPATYLSPPDQVDIC